MLVIDKINDVVSLAALERNRLTRPLREELSDMRSLVKSDPDGWERRETKGPADRHGGTVTTIEYTYTSPERTYKLHGEFVATLMARNRRCGLEIADDTGTEILHRRRSQNGMNCLKALEKHNGNFFPLIGSWLELVGKAK